MTRLDNRQTVAILAALRCYQQYAPGIYDSETRTLLRNIANGGGQFEPLDFYQELDTLYETIAAADAIEIVSSQDNVCYTLAEIEVQDGEHQYTTPILLQVEPSQNAIDVAWGAVINWNEDLDDRPVDRDKMYFSPEYCIAVCVASCIEVNALQFQHLQLACAVHTPSETDIQRAIAYRSGAASELWHREAEINSTNQ
ncbi:hypothetical protein ACQ4M3_01085 [Leptolyngbya sp. AN03gr2]|uniref:hypothetical protein n=1 Tax=unclassified Leptolyngbya TaxID=2650499 RepID=UPI003D31734C